MKKILIIGKDSYIGKNLKKHFLNRSKGFIVNSISIRTEGWKSINFGIYDCVIYLAAAKPEHEEGSSEILNYHLNADMPYEIAQTAKDSGVPRFVYTSTIEVYGISSGIGCSTMIKKGTEPSPKPYTPKVNLREKTDLKDLKTRLLKLPY